MFSFFRKNNSRVCIDISESSVGLALVHDLPHPTLCTHTRISYGVCAEEITPEIVKLRLQELIEHTMRSCKNNGHHFSTNPGEIAISLSRPWQTTSMVPVVKKSPSPFMFTQQIMNELISERIKITFDPARVNVDTTIVDAKLNGYRIDNPIGKMITRAEAVLLVSVTEKEFTTKISQTIRNHFHSSPINFIPYTKLYLSLLRAHSSISFPVLFVHVRNESTRVVRLAVEGITAAYDMPKGLYALSSGHENKSGDELISSFADDLVVAFKEIATTTSLPKSVALLVDGSSSDFFEKVLATPSVTKMWYAESAPTYVLLSDNNVQKSDNLADLSFDGMLHALASYRERRVHSE